MRPWLAAIACLVAAGCESVGSDFSDFVGSLAPKSPGEAARMAADPTDPDARREGVMLLSSANWGGAEPYMKLYREYAEHDLDPIVRAMAVRALSRHGTPEDAVLVAANLSHENLQVRWEAAKGLQRLHNDDVVTPMLATLRNDDEDQDVRTAIARGLGQYSQDRVFQALVAALDDRELEVNLGARESLVTMTGQDRGLEPSSWLDWYQDVSNTEGGAFAGRHDYLYPTYVRSISFLEKLAFWSTPTFEQPAPPAGLKPMDERSTYQDEDGERGGE